MTLEKLRTLYKDMGIEFKNKDGGNDDLTLMRSILYFIFIKEVYDSFTLYDKESNSIRYRLENASRESYKKFEKAFNAPGFLLGLCETLDEFIIKAVDADLTAQKQRYGQYFGDDGNLFRHYPQSVSKFLEVDYPKMFDALEKVSSNFKENIYTACVRLLKDWKVVDNVFAPPRQSLRVLTRIQSTGSDFHKGGQQVLILTFSLNPGPAKCRIVYKPSDLELDCLIVGDSKSVNSIHNRFQEASLMELLNALLKESPGLKLEPFPTYKILPFSYGSGLRKQDGKLPIRISYGYIEFLEGGDSNDPSDPIAWANSKIVSKDKKEISKVCDKFYRVLGQLTAIAGVFSFSDLHMQNLIVHLFLPYLIDLENSFIRPIEELRDTELMLGVPIVGGVIDGIVYQVEAINSAELNSDSKAIALDMKYKYANNRLWVVPDRLICVPEFGDSMLKSLDDTLDFLHFALHKGENPFQSFFDRLKKGVVVRLVPLPTSKFHNIIKQAIESFKISSDTYIIKEIAAAYEERKLDWQEKPSGFPNFLCLQGKYVIDDMLAIDIPIFYHQLGTLDVLDSHGTTIETNVDRKGPTFFLKTPIAHVESNQLLNLRDAKECDQRKQHFRQDLLRYAISPPTDVNKIRGLVTQ